MVQHTEGRPSIRLFKSSSSESTLRSEATPFKSTYSNQIPADAQNISGKLLKRPAGSILALILEILLCLVALCFIGNLALAHESISRYTNIPIALALGALCINNRPTGDRLGTVMEEAMKLVRKEHSGESMFPNGLPTNWDRGPRYTLSYSLHCFLVRSKALVDTVPRNL